ncbi:unnamed protein product [Brassicogethes aeneus]|uniref:Uncharacterized protein n=1 Tax=Brassicogethes aeneus TaxID=1431903 RepID=A0A9P0FIH0_BRAAE|nr:unnamed protein product [Brassicogethes aeneus]
MTLRSTVIRFSLLLFLIKYTLCDEYVSEIRDKCFKSKIILYCGHFRFIKYLMKFYSEPEELKETSYNNSETVKFVKLNNETINFKTFPNMRQITDDSEVTKMVKFMTRKTLSYFNTNGLLVNLPDGSLVVDLKNESTLNLDNFGPEEMARGKKHKKKMLIIPIFLLFKLFKVKVIVSIILSGILFIKKIMLVIAFLLPAMFASLKAHCKPEPTFLHAEERYSYPEDNGYYNGWPNDPYYY